MGSVPMLFGTRFVPFNTPLEGGIALDAATCIILDMAAHKRDEIRDEDITGLKFFDKLRPLLFLFNPAARRAHRATACCGL